MALFDAVGMLAAACWTCRHDNFNNFKLQCSCKNIRFWLRLGTSTAGLVLGTKESGLGYVKIYTTYSEKIVDRKYFFTQINMSHTGLKSSLSYGKVLLTHPTTPSSSLH